MNDSCEVKPPKLWESRRRVCNYSLSNWHPCIFWMQRRDRFVPLIGASEVFHGLSRYNQFGYMGVLTLSILIGPAGMHYRWLVGCYASVFR
ncbi:hypothetical protein OG21DRAFT_520065 [Imleria badia]|nr:hypothetical protein OG21DRAFT_520065 [Imleria badia]